MNLFTVRCESLKVPEKNIKYCYAMSKMTVSNEEFHTDQYFTMQFVEFLEMIGRIALYKYQGTIVHQEPLAKKIEFVIDILFEVVGAHFKRNEVCIEEPDVSDEDIDY